MRNRFNARRSIATVALLIVNATAGSLPAQKASMPAKHDKVALGAGEVKELLALMDADKNGKISRAEFMAFMQAEFDRLDKDGSGELDQKELTQSQLQRVKPFSGK